MWAQPGKEFCTVMPGKGLLAVYQGRLQFPMTILHQLLLCSYVRQCFYTLT